MLVTLDGIATLVKLIHSEKALSSISVTFIPSYSSGITIIDKYCALPTLTPNVPSSNG